MKFITNVGKKDIKVGDFVILGSAPTIIIRDTIGYRLLYLDSAAFSDLYCAESLEELVGLINKDNKQVKIIKSENVEMREIN